MLVLRSACPGTSLRHTAPRQQARLLTSAGALTARACGGATDRVARLAGRLDDYLLSPSTPRASTPYATLQRRSAGCVRVNRLTAASATIEHRETHNSTAAARGTSILTRTRALLRGHCSATADLSGDPSGTGVYDYDDEVEETPESTSITCGAKTSSISAPGPIL